MELKTVDILATIMVEIITTEENTATVITVAIMGTFQIKKIKEKILKFSIFYIKCNFDQSQQ